MPTPSNSTVSRLEKCPLSMHVGSESHGKMAVTAMSTHLFSTVLLYVITTKSSPYGRVSCPPTSWWLLVASGVVGS